MNKEGVMMTLKSKLNKIKEVGAAAQKDLGLRHRAGMLFGANLFMGCYDIYRRYTPFLLAAAMVYFIISGREAIGLVFLALLHIQILLNQIYWGMKDLEKTVEISLNEFQTKK